MEIRPSNIKKAPLRVAEGAFLWAFCSRVKGGRRIWKNRIIFFGVVGNCGELCTWAQFIQYYFKTPFQMMPEKIDLTNKHERYQFTVYTGFVRSDMELLGQYKYAINVLIKHLKDTKERADMVGHPILYMMRHSLELGYKSNFKYLAKYSQRQSDKKGVFGSHNLQILHNEFREHFELISQMLNFDQNLVEEFYNHYNLTTNLIHQLGAEEISSFRYVTNTKGHLISESTETKDW